MKNEKIKIKNGKWKMKNEKWKWTTPRDRCEMGELGLTCSTPVRAALRRLATHIQRTIVPSKHRTRSAHLLFPLPIYSTPEGNGTTRLFGPKLTKKWPEQHHKIHESRDLNKASKRPPKEGPKRGQNCPSSEQIEISSFLSPRRLVFVFP